MKLQDITAYFLRDSISFLNLFKFLIRFLTIILFVTKILIDGSYKASLIQWRTAGVQMTFATLTFRIRREIFSLSYWLVNCTNYETNHWLEHSSGNKKQNWKLLLSRMFLALAQFVLESEVRSETQSSIGLIGREFESRSISDRIAASSLAFNHLPFLFTNIL